MFRPLLAAALALPLALLPLAARAEANPATEQQALVDRATLTVQDLLTNSNSADVQSLLRRARAVMVCPRIFRAGFFFGGEGGGCVLVARDGGGSWSGPAFYGMGSGSFGLQIGIQDAQVLMLILTGKGLDAVMDSQFKIGADAGVALAMYGAGIQGATTAALRADIVVFSLARGLFAGISVEGSLMTARTDWNRMYYGRDLAARQVVIDMQATNQGADPLREMLTRYGTP